MVAFPTAATSQYSPEIPIQETTNQRRLGRRTATTTPDRISTLLPIGGVIQTWLLTKTSSSASRRERKNGQCEPLVPRESTNQLTAKPIQSTPAAAQFVQRRRDWADRSSRNVSQTRQIAAQGSSADGWESA